MKKVLLVSALVIGGLPFQAAMAAGPSIGIKAGILSIENDQDSAPTAGASIAIGIPASPFGLEADANTTVSDGKFKSGNNYSASQVGGFGYFAVPPGPVQVKLRAGAMYTNVDVSGAGSTNDTSFAYGLSGNVGHYEVSWTQTKVKDSNVNFISVGYNF